ncbi:MAG TPA: metallophosphoesterase [Thermoanaerobaculia bacterium]|nr:metallophosphoesterase [Thermoanaerobaculia bacterium]
MLCRITLALLILALPAAGQAPPPPVTIVAVGDVACDPADSAYNGGAGTATRCRMMATSDLALGLQPAAVLLLGDNQYEDGTLAKYQASYDPSWGRLKAVTKPVPGNHEYMTPGAQGYFTYFGAAAGDPAKGYYSFDLGGWHLIALNSNCGAVGGCGAASPQGQWLAADLAAHPGVCTLAYWHHPRFSSGPHGVDPTFGDFWNLLYEAGADVVLTGHDHGYERFAPQSPAAVADPAGIRQFVVGNGGKNLTSVTTVRANSEVRNYSAFGVLELKLYPNGYKWKFLGVNGATLDSGQGLCHSALPSKELDFHTVVPCRVADTRISSPLAAGVPRIFPVAGSCGIPAEAVAVAANVKAVSPSAAGHLQVFPAGAPLSEATVASFRANVNRSGSAILPLGVAGEVEAISSSATHFVLDVSGYFAPSPE